MYIYNDACTYLKHSLTKEDGSLETHVGPYRYIHVSTQLCKVGDADVVSHVDIHTCTDACTHSNQGVEPDEG